MTDIKVLIDRLYEQERGDYLKQRATEAYKRNCVECGYDGKTCPCPNFSKDFDGGHFMSKEKFAKDIDVRYKQAKQDWHDQKKARAKWRACLGCMKDRTNCPCMRYLIMYGFGSFMTKEEFIASKLRKSDNVFDLGKFFAQEQDRAHDSYSKIVQKKRGRKKIFIKFRKM